VERLDSTSGEGEECEMTERSKLSCLQKIQPNNLEPSKPCPNNGSTAGTCHTVKPDSWPKTEVVTYSIQIWKEALHHHEREREGTRLEQL
jgi:hypothetical protein